METIREVNNKCYHCGEDNEDSQLVLDDHFFCCEGCKTVYEILKEGDLCEYYRLNENPGISGRDKNPQAYQFLDTPEGEASFIKYKDEKQVQLQFSIPGMHCSSCIWLLENLHKLDTRIFRASINFVSKELFIAVSSDMKLSELAALLDKTGYPPALTMNDLDPAEKKQGYFNKRYFYKLGIAFFCFGNIMLLSFPEYFGTENSWRKLFGYLNFALALPVMFYSATEFFTSAWNGLKMRKLNMDFPIALGLIIMFTVSSWDIFFRQGGGYMDTLASLVFLMLTGRALQNYTHAKISFDRDYKSYFPVSVTVLEEGSEKNIPATKIIPGMRLLIRNGELIPADSILFRGNGQIDYSFVTGESAPVPVTTGEIIYAGGRQSGAAIEAEVIREVSQSYLTRLWNEQGNFKKEKLESLSGRVSGIFTIIILVIATASALFWIRTDLSKAIQAFTSVLIITCPCALALSTPFTLGNATRIFGKYKMYLRDSGIVEKLATTDTVIFDKTGTLTEAGKAKVTYHGELLSEQEITALLSIARSSSHPFSRMICESFGRKKIIPSREFEEVPGKGICGKFNDLFIRIGSEKWILSTNEARILNVSKVWISVNDKPKGYFSIENFYRPEAEEVISELKKENSIFVLSGDHEGEKQNLQKLTGKNVILKFNQSPYDKMNYIRDLQNKEHHTVMIGDGLNDAGALLESNCGIAISENLNHFSPGCDAILDASSFKHLPRFIRLAKAAKKIIIASFILSFIYNVAGLTFAVQGELSPLIAAVLMPLSSITIILFTTSSVNLAGLRIFSSSGH